MGLIMLRLTRVVRQQYSAQCFGNIPGFNLWKLSRLSGVFPPFVGHFFNRAREPEGKLHHVVYEVWLVSYLFFSFQIWYFRKWIITSIGQSKHMRVTRFNPSWVSGIVLFYLILVLYFIVYPLILFHCNLGCVFLSFDWIKTIITIIITIIIIIIIIRKHCKPCWWSLFCPFTVTLLDMSLKL